MAYKYLFQLNGEELLDVSIGVGVVEKLEEPLDEGGLHLPFSIRNYEYEMRGLLQITAQDDLENQLEFSFLVVGDRVSEGSKYGEWKHDLSVVEYSHKLDNYMIHSLSKTKSLKNENPAPFIILPNSYNYFDIRVGDVTSFVARANLEPINVLSQYYTGETIIFPQVRQSYTSTTTNPDYWDSYVRENVFIRTNATGLNEITLNDGDGSWVFPKGNWYIEYGFGTSNKVAIYRYYIRVIDREQISVLDLVNLVRNNVSKYGGIESKLYFDSTRLFDIDPNIEDYISKVEAPQTYIQKATARQVLNSIFIYINSISRLKYVSGSNDLLSMDEFNLISGSFEVGDVAGYSTSQEATKLFNKGISWLERALPNDMDEATIETPAQGLYKTVRSKSIQMTQDDFELPLERAIYQPKKIEALLPEISIKNISGTQERLYEDFILDFTPRLINDSEWKLKLITNDFPDIVTQEIFSGSVGLRENKVANVMWKQGDVSLNFSELFGQAFQSNLITNVIREHVNEYFTRNMPEPFIIETEMSTKIILEYTLPSFREQTFNLEYITLEDVTIASEREDISNSHYYTEGRINQSDKLVNVGLASRDAYGMVQRSGVPNRTFTKYHENFTTLLDIGWQDENGYVIVQRKLEFHNEYIKATYMATKDHNRLSEFKGVDQLYRWSEIPSSNQVNQRIEFYNDYLYALNPSSEYGIEEQVTKHYGDLAVELILGTLINDWYDSVTDGKTKTSLAYVRTDGFLEEYPDDMTYQYAIATPVASYGIKGGFVFGFGFENNQVAGDGLRKEVINESLNKYFNEAVRYTNADGRFDELWFALANKYSNANDGYTDFERLSAYPLIRTTDDDFGYLLDTYFRSGVQDPTSEYYDALVIEKDTSQSIKISYQNTVISAEYLKYIFGQRFYSENFIVKNPIVDYNVIKGTPKYLYRYTNGTVYGKFDDLRVKSGYYTKTLLSSANASISNNTLTLTISMSGITSWAIGDNDENLYLACNTNYGGVKFLKRHFRFGMYEIGDTDISSSFNINITLSDTITVASVLTTIGVYNFSCNLTSTIEVNDTPTIYKSTNFVIQLDETISISSSISSYQSNNYHITLLDTVEINDSPTVYKSTNFVITLDETITVSSTVTATDFVFPTFEFTDSLEVSDTPTVYKSTDFVIILSETISISSTLSMLSVEFVNLEDDITIYDDLSVVQSTNYATNLSDTMTVSDDVTTFKSTNFVITLDETIEVSSTIDSEQTTTNWVYIGTSGSYDQTITYVASGSICATSGVIDTWLETNYPAENYAYSYIMRVARGNENLVPCSPVAYYYQAR